MLKKKHYVITKQTYNLVFSNLLFVFFHLFFLDKLIKISTLSESQNGESKNRNKHKCLTKKTLEDNNVDMDSSKIFFLLNTSKDEQFKFN